MGGVNIISRPPAASRFQAPSPPPCSGPRRHTVRLDPEEHFVAQQDIHPSKWTRVKTALRLVQAWQCESALEIIVEEPGLAKKVRVLAEVDHILSMPVHDICDYLAAASNEDSARPSAKPLMHPLPNTHVALELW